MTNESNEHDSQSQQEWETYLQVFLEESDEDLESLIQAILRLETDPSDQDSLNEAFRLLHTHKGSAGVMGFEGISDLAHQLEDRFDQFRSGKATLSQAQITVLLKCVDFLRDFNAGLRSGGQPSQDAPHLIQELEKAEQSKGTEQISQPAIPQEPILFPSLQGGYRVRVEFEEGLQLADMKARLIVARVSNLGEIIATDPPVEETQSFDDLSQFMLIVLTDRDPEEVKKIANVDGVKSVTIEGGSATTTSEPGESPELNSAPATGAVAMQGGPEPQAAAESMKQTAQGEPLESDLSAHGPSDSEAQPESSGERSAAAETVRVGIDRLDKLMNLTGELAVTRERIAQVTAELDAAMKAGRSGQRLSGVGERFRATLARLEDLIDAPSENFQQTQKLLAELADEILLVEEQTAAWEERRRCFSRIAESVDQLSRVSGSLQQSVLDTRMVPVSPLFNRFRRVIRDLATERNKQVRLEIHGEKTELDKRMIDELGDPLLHLVRNSLDHGLETPDVRRKLGKPEIGTIALEATHRGNNVFITVRDDGFGLDVDRIKKRIIDREIADAQSVSMMTDDQIIEHIWHPGFSTAEQITDISGRGVGMDVVKSRISELNGSIEVRTQPNEGTSFQLRLPLTLAIMRCMLVRFRNGCFSMPIDDVREIVAVQPEEIHHVHGHQSIDVRGEFIPLIQMDRVFYWADRHAASANGSGPDSPQATTEVNSVVVLQSGGRTMGLGVDELLGSTDIVIKSLMDNFVSIRGLSGASIMGDGSVCLMLDTGEVVKMAAERASGGRPALAV